ncbi:Pkinase-domain-containing protein [Rhizopus microsporus ATCC 52813]|uniref:Pkinase-domain-containing protein n=1 Tax=Rhizopus microsporus ATCC 52813 TaxID=1340429 RepID=A0A2G4SW74_RHIZD|nr:Pkinase-domain-containing protein [Rhizopus microsporus ATCC 52813]PHZ13031.1 Pkinase-domain-containing protein [Rhizopus microsporus ATCC 52813]
MVRSKKKEIPEDAILYSAQQPNATCIDDYIVIDELGQGAYGLVKVAVKKDDPEKASPFLLFVIKYVIKSRILIDCWTSDQMLGTIPVEIHILHTLRKIPHKNISDMLDYFEDDDYYYIVMEFRETMDLFDYIEYNEQINEDNIRKIFKQIALGVKHLHDHRIVHRDIKDENVVVDKDLNVQIVDFGSAAYIKQGRKYETFVGTLDYAAPEILRGQTYSGKPQDVWALGILLFTLIYRENPFYDIDEIMSQELRIPFVLSKGSVDLIYKMLERDVDKRIDIQTVLDHPWLN